MATAATITAPAKHKGFVSVLEVIGKDIKSVFAWIGSSKGQATIAAGESTVEAIFPAAAGIIAIANLGLNEAVKVEALAAAAGAQNGTGVQKSAALVSVLTPEILSYAEKNGFPTPTADKIQIAADSLVGFLNALSGSSTASTTTAA